MGTIVIFAAVALVVALVIRSMIRNKKSGRSSCGCGCSTCAMNGQCHSKDESQDIQS
ncbi:MAG TPA: FeoB-associated Cys-rich membrane protein [Ruminococcus sp.]|mgnify:CR=1 FL=1